MAWVKMESSFPFNHKVAEAGPVAAFLDVCGWCYCRTHGTDGFIPEAHIAMLGPVPDPRKHAAKLVSVGRWHRDDELLGWWVHDFLEFNPSDAEERAAAAQRSEKASEAARARWRTKKGITKKVDAQTDAQSIATSMGPSNAGGNARRMLGGCSDDAPLPSPPLPLPEHESVGTSTVVPMGGFAPSTRRRNGEPQPLGASLAAFGIGGVA